MKRKSLLVLGELSARLGPIGLHADGGEELLRNVQTPRNPAPETSSGSALIRGEISGTVDRSSPAMFTDYRAGESFRQAALRGLRRAVLAEAFGRPPLRRDLPEASPAGAAGMIAVRVLLALLLMASGPEAPQAVCAAEVALGD